MISADAADAMNAVSCVPVFITLLHLQRIRVTMLFEDPRPPQSHDGGGDPYYTRENICDCFTRKKRDIISQRRYNTLFSDHA